MQMYTMYCSLSNRPDQFYSEIKTFVSNQPDIDPRVTVEKFTFAVW